MAGELCSRDSCAWCGRCDAEPEDRCDCGRADCLGDCSKTLDVASVEPLTLEHAESVEVAS